MRCDGGWWLIFNLLSLFLVRCPHLKSLILMDHHTNNNHQQQPSHHNIKIYSFDEVLSERDDNEMNLMKIIILLTMLSLSYHQINNNQIVILLPSHNLPSYYLTVKHLICLIIHHPLIDRFVWLGELIHHFTIHQGEMTLQLFVIRQVMMMRWW